MLYEPHRKKGTGGVLPDAPLLPERTGRIIFAEVETGGSTVAKSGAARFCFGSLGHTCAPKQTRTAGQRESVAEEPKFPPDAEPPLERPPLPDKAKSGVLGDAELWRLAGLGGQLALTVGLFVLLGWWLDNKFGWTPWGMVSLGSLGVAAALYQMLKDVLK
jgi:hypothetical protein